MVKEICPYRNAFLNCAVEESVMTVSIAWDWGKGFALNALI